MYQFQGQQAYNQSSAGPPPAKRQKGNTVVTYYPPPPGYVPPPNAQIPPGAWQAAGYNAGAYGTAQQQFNPQYAQQYGQQYGQQQYQQQSYYQGYGQVGHNPYQGYPGYPPQNGWQQQQQLTPQPPPYGYPQAQPPYPQPQQQQQQQPQVQMQSHQAETFQYNPQQYPPPGYPHPAAGSPQTLTPASDNHPQNPSQLSRHASMSFSAPAESVTGEDDDEPSNGLDESNFAREASFAKEADAIQPEFSLGIIVYYPARSIKTCLPSTFEEGQAQMHDAIPRDGEVQSVSRYFNQAQSANFSLHVRETEGWQHVKDDIIFHVFAPTAEADYTALTSVKQDRYRADTDRESRGQPSVTTELQSNHSSASSPAEDRATPVEAIVGNDEDDQAMDTDSDDDDAPVVQKVPAANDAGNDVIRLEPNLVKAEGVTPPVPLEAPTQDKSAALNETAKRDIPIDRSMSEVNPEEDPVVMAANRDSVSRTPASLQNDFLPPDFRRNSSEHSPHGAHPQMGRRNSAAYYTNGRQQGNRSLSNTNMPFGPHNVPPPPELDNRTPWNAAPRVDHHRRSGSIGSNTSQHTEPGGDFDAESVEHNKSPGSIQRPTQQPGSGRKRGYDEMERTNGDDRRRQTDDVTPRMRRGRPKVPDAYSRRYR